MAPKLYTIVFSPNGRSVQLTSKAINLELEIIVLDPTKLDHLSPEFLKINPEHKVPTLTDDGLMFWNSHAINAYLVDKYAKDDSLYPKDLQKRALVNQRLFFDSGVLQPAMHAITAPLFRAGQKVIPRERVAQLTQAYAALENALQDKKYITGDTVTIADFNIVSTISSCIALVPIAANRFPNITQWLTQMQSLPYYKEANQIGADLFAKVIKSDMAQM